MAEAFEFNHGVIDDLEGDPMMTDFLQYVGDEVADVASAQAPKRSGEGAASIHAVVGVDDAGNVCVDVSWDPEHFYMGLVETGTQKMPARPFLRPALAAVHI